jgi:hypothetical protein
MIWVARAYDTEGEAAIAYERLTEVEKRLPEQDRIILRLVNETGEEWIVVLGHKKKDKHVHRIKDGHWVGGDPYELSEGELLDLDLLAKNLMENTEHGERVRKTWSPSEPGRLDDEGNIR